MLAYGIEKPRPWTLQRADEQTRIDDEKQLVKNVHWILKLTLSRTIHSEDTLFKIMHIIFNIISMYILFTRIVPSILSGYVII